jgi:hypothetical protein
MAELTISGTGGETVDVTKEARIQDTGSKTRHENPIIYGITSVGILAFNLLQH